METKVIEKVKPYIIPFDNGAGQVTELIVIMDGKIVEANADGSLPFYMKAYNAFKWLQRPYDRLQHVGEGSIPSHDGAVAVMRINNADFHDELVTFWGEAVRAEDVYDWFEPAGWAIHTSSHAVETYVAVPKEDYLEYLI
jgi:hypothetical protein